MKHAWLCWLIWMRRVEAAAPILPDTPTHEDRVLVQIGRPDARGLSQG